MNKKETKRKKFIFPGFFPFLVVTYQTDKTCFIINTIFSKSLNIFDSKDILIDKFLKVFATSSSIFPNQLLFHLLLLKICFFLKHHPISRQRFIPQSHYIKSNQHTFGLYLYPIFLSSGTNACPPGLLWQRRMKQHVISAQETHIVSAQWSLTGFIAWSQNNCKRCWVI